VSKDVYPVLDAGNTKTGSNVNVTYNGIDTRPKISLSQGSGSGLDADTVDGYDGGDLAALSEDERVTGNWKFDSGNRLTPEVIFDKGHSISEKADIIHFYRRGGGKFYLQMLNGDHLAFRETNNSNVNLYLERSSGRVGVNTTDPSRTLDVHGDGVEIRNDSSNQNALRVIQRKNDPDAPASILVATDDDGEDVAFEVRGKGDGSSVDLTENTQTSGDMNLQIWSSGKINTKGTVDFSNANSVIIPIK
jgi:hypothetical protein